MYLTKAAKLHLHELGHLSTNTEMLKYCKENLTRLGAGSSREVFALSDTLVVKVAKGGTGVKQNENEIRVWNLVDYSFTGMKRSFAKVLIEACHWKDFFIVMERLDKLSNKNLFNSYSMRLWRTSRTARSNVERRLYKDVSNTDDNAFTNNFADISPRNMGVSRSGVVKMLDYGFSTNIWNGLASGKLKNREKLCI
jgi:hypothetical protein